GVLKSFQSPQDRVIGSAGKRRFPLVAITERDQRSLFEIKREIRLFTRPILVDKAAINAPHFEGSFFQVMSLFGIQCKDLPRQFPVWSDECGDGLRAQTAHGFESMASVRRPESAASRSRHRDDRVEEGACFHNHSRQFFGMSLREVSLERRGCDRMDRKNRNYEWRPTERIPPRTGNQSPVLFDAIDHVTNLGC